VGKSINLKQGKAAYLWGSCGNCIGKFFELPSLVGDPISKMGVSFLRTKDITCSVVISNVYMWDSP